MGPARPRPRDHARRLVLNHHRQRGPLLPVHRWRQLERRGRSVHAQGDGEPDAEPARLLVRPGFYGNTTACGKKLRKGTIGVAHKKLPCGTKVTFAYEGRWVRAKVIDRGPYIDGRKWDLTYQTALQLGTIDAGTATVKAVAAP